MRGRGGGGAAAAAGLRVRVLVAVRVFAELIGLLNYKQQVPLSPGWHIVFTPRLCFSQLCKDSGKLKRSLLYKPIYKGCLFLLIQIFLFLFSYFRESEHK